MYDELKERCRACSQGCVYPSECSYFNKPPLRCMRQLLSEASDAIEELQDALLLMVLQYCTTDDGLLYHSFMSAGENAFAVLSLENGQQADPLWDRVLNQKPPKEET